MRRSRFLALGCLLLTQGLPPARAEITAYPAAGHTVIHAVGNTGVRLSLPQEVTLERRQVELKTDAVAAFVGFGGRTPDGRCEVFPNDEEACIIDQEWLVQDSPIKPTFVGHSPPTWLTGFLDIYIVSTGTVDLTIDFTGSGLTGEIEVAADRPIDAVLQRLDRRCVVDDCSIGHGGNVHPQTSPGFLSVIGWAGSDNIEAGSDSIDVCIYPSQSRSRSDSSRPEDHPFGCDSSADSYRNAGHDADYVVETAALVRAKSVTMIERRGTGDEYLGFRGHAITAPDRVGYGAFGVWINPGL